MRLLVFFMLAGLLLSGCRSSKKTDWTVTLDADDARPYGAKLLAGSLPHWFGEAQVKRLQAGFRYDDLDNTLTERPGERALLVLFGLEFYVSSREWDALEDWVADGNDLIIFASDWDAKLLERLRLQKKYVIPTEEERLDSFAEAALRYQAVWLTAAPGRRYTHRGRSLLGSFSLSDTAGLHTADDGYEIGAPQPVGSGSEGITSLRYPIGDGWLTLHTAPLVLSNYFLLQGTNRGYLNGFWQAAASRRFGAVFWQDYYKRKAEGASWGVLWRYPATRWAISLALLTALLYVLFEAKRRQRIVPIIKPSENSSVLFVETVGRLYYRQGNHQNLAEKMVQQALETIRTKYRLSTESLDPALAKALARKTALPESLTIETIRLCEAVRSGTLQVTETDLYHLHQTLRPLLR